MRMILAVPGALLVMLAACEPGDAPPQDNGAARRITIANPHHDRLASLSPELQRLGMMRGIRATGNRCRAVDNAGYQQEYNNLRMWVATCGAEQKTWAVFVAPNGDLQVRDCAQAGQLSLPRCRPLPPAAPVAESPFQEGASDNAFRTRIVPDEGAR